MRHPVFESLYDRIPDSLMELAGWEGGKLERKLAQQSTRLRSVSCRTKLTDRALLPTHETPVLASVGLDYFSVWRALSRADRMSGL